MYFEWSTSTSNGGSECTCRPLMPHILERKCFAVTIVAWPHSEQHPHCVHYVAGIFGLTPFKEAGPFPVSCLSHPLYLETPRLMCCMFSQSSLSLLMCKQALIVSETCCRAHPGFLPPGNKSSFLLAGRGGSTLSFPSMASHSFSCLSFTCPSPRLRQTWAVCGFLHIMIGVRLMCRNEKQWREHHLWGSVRQMGRGVCVSLSVCLFSFNTRGLHSELACKSPCVCL